MHAKSSVSSITERVRRPPASRPLGHASGEACSPRAAPAVPAVTRALALLDRLADQRTPMSLARLSSELALPKSSVHGLCATLLSSGYLRRQSDGAFLIGPRVMTLADAFVASTGVAQQFDALWQDSVSPPDETMVLSVLAGAEVVYIATRNGVRPLGLSFSVGMRLPAHLSATGQAQLAFQPPADVARLLLPAPLDAPTDGGPPTAWAWRALDGTPAAKAGQAGDGSPTGGSMPAAAADRLGAPLPRLTSRGPATLAALEALLARARQRGYSVDDQGIREGVIGIGAPVFDAAGKVLAGVGVCLHKPTLDAAHRARQRAIVMDAARVLTQRLGGRFPAAAAAARGGAS